MQGYDTCKRYNQQYNSRSRGPILLFVRFNPFKINRHFSIHERIHNEQIEIENTIQMQKKNVRSQYVCKTQNYCY